MAGMQMDWLNPKPRRASQMVMDPAQANQPLVSGLQSGLPGYNSVAGSQPTPDSDLVAALMQTPQAGQAQSDPRMMGAGTQPVKRKKAQQVQETQDALQPQFQPLASPQSAARDTQRQNFVEQIKRSLLMSKGLF